MNKFEKDFEYFWDLIEKNINFSYVRYADGEVLLMRGNEVGKVSQAFITDKWYSPNTLTKVGRELLETLEHTENNFYYAISGINDSIDDYKFLRSNIPQKEENITFANLWINNNYQKMKNKLLNLKREVILICNHSASKENFPFAVEDITPFPDDCINFWDKHGDDFLKNIVKKYGNFKNKLFFISCGPISEIIIHELYKNNPENSYIDVGSSIDEFVHGRPTRPYMIPNSFYGKLISHF
jgi:hypothetical protein